MYYPYLRAKQMELLALRDFVEQKRGGGLRDPDYRAAEVPRGRSTVEQSIAQRWGMRSIFQVRG